MPILKQSILQMQQEGVLDGQLRIGTSVPGEKGGKRPVKLKTWRMTSPARRAVEAAAEQFGGEVKPWDSDRGPQWEAVTTRAELPVQFGGGATVDQWMTHYDRGVCMRRCTGAADAVNEVSGRPCECNATGRDLCKPETKLRVRFLELPGIGWWRFTSHGKFVAAGFPMRAAFLKEAASQGVYVPARLVMREMKLPAAVPGAPGRRFPVVDIEIDVSVAQIEAGEGGVGTLREIAAARRQPLALPPGAPPALPVAPNPPAAPAADQAVPAGRPVSDEPPTVRAQRYADAALRTASLDGDKGLRNIGYHANREGLLEEYVATSTDEPESLLRDVLEDAMERLTQQIEPAEADPATGTGLHADPSEGL